MKQKSSLVTLTQCSQIQTLQHNEILIVYTLIPSLINEATLNSFLQILSPDELSRYHRFHFNKDRYLYLYSRSLLRLVLSKCYAVDPAEWKFRFNAYGRPEIDYPVTSPMLNFNISHTSGIVAIAVTLERKIGIDVECKQNNIDFISIADRLFSVKEADVLRTLTDVNSQQRRFTEYWTLKEAYAKARGVGLSLSFNQFCFHIDSGTTIHVEFDSDLDDDPTNWKFIQFHPTNFHCIAVAVKREAYIDLTIKLLEVFSLDEELRITTHENKQTSI